MIGARALPTRRADAGSFVCAILAHAAVAMAPASLPRARSAVLDPIELVAAAEPPEAEAPATPETPPEEAMPARPTRSVTTATVPTAPERARAPETTRTQEPAGSEAADVALPLGFDGEIAVGSARGSAAGLAGGTAGLGSSSGSGLGPRGGSVAEKAQPLATDPGPAVAARVDVPGGCDGAFPANAMHDEAVVTLRVRIAATGTLEAVMPVSEVPTGEGFGEAAARCVRARAKVSAATSAGGVPVPAFASVVVRFLR